MTTLTLDELLELRTLGGVDVSPDGDRVAFTVTEGATAKGELPESRVWTCALDGEAREATHGPGRDALPRHSPDGARLAFASDRDRPGLMGLYVLAGSGDAEPVGDLRGSVEDIHWSRDGGSLLVLAADPGSDLAGGQSAKKVEAEGAEQDPIVRRPSQAWRRLYRVDVGSGETTEVSPEGLNVWEVGWSGEGHAVAVVSDEPTESAWYVARVALLDLERRRARTLHEPEWQVQSPDISADGRRVAFVEGFNSDRTVIAGTTTVVDVETGATTTLALDRDVVAVRWLAGDRVFGVGLRGLETMCVRMALDGSVEELWRGPATLGHTHRMAAACSRDGRIVAAAKESPTEPPEVAVLAGGAWRTARPARDGLEIEGILLRPADAPEEPLPLVVIVHGGPTNAWTFTFGPGYMHLGIGLGNAGYAVLLPNPRGSTGRGQEFARANLGDMGGEDLQDILAGVDALVEAGIADRARVGITGASYGGFMSAWAITQTDAFAASVPCACVSDWLSFHNTSNIGRFDELFLQSDPYDPTGDYFARSPVMQIRHCTTPTLVLHGELDLCTPVGQAQELYQALVDIGCETELVIYPRGGHGWVEREHLIDTFERTHAWFERHFSARAAAPVVAAGS